MAEGWRRSLQWGRLKMVPEKTVDVTPEVREATNMLHDAPIMCLSMLSPTPLGASTGFGGALINEFYYVLFIIDIVLKSPTIACTSLGPRLCLLSGAETKPVLAPMGGGWGLM